MQFNGYCPEPQGLASDAPRIWPVEGPGFENQYPIPWPPGMTEKKGI